MNLIVNQYYLHSKKLNFNKKQTMKLNRDDLSFALVCAKSYYYDSLNSDYPNKDDLKNAELFRDLEQEADNDTLEIEGYERVQWTRFDPNDPKTFPPSGGFLGYFTGQCGDKYQDVHFRNNEYTDEEFATRMVYHNLTHWRPLPSDPVETEKN